MLNRGEPGRQGFLLNFTWTNGNALRSRKESTCFEKGSRKAPPKEKVVCNGVCVLKGKQRALALTRLPFMCAQLRWSSWLRAMTRVPTVWLSLA